MYSNEYDVATLTNSFTKRSKRLTRLHQRPQSIYQENEYMHHDAEESEEGKADEELCWKCKGETADANKNTTTFPHIQDLCPADRKRIARLVKQLIKCTKEMRDAKSEVVVRESEKESMRNQYEKSLDLRETEKKQLEFQLKQAQDETNDLKSRIARILELLTRQIATQEKQFFELTETVRGLVHERFRLQSALVEKQTEAGALEGECQRAKDLLEAERLERNRDNVRKVHQACQTEMPEITASIVQEEFDRESISCHAQNTRVKSKDDLEEPSTEGTLLRDLFFRKPSIEENGTLDVIPVLSETDLQSKRSGSMLLI